jgi:predicted DNA binding CopG/RHH family protein
MRKEYDLKKLKPRKGPVKVDKDAAKVPISLRVDGSVLSSLKSEADRLGLPYQTYIGSLLHQYVNGELIEKKTIELLKRFKVS